MGSIELDEQGLWKRSLQGDPDAFGALFDRHRDRVFRHAFRLAQDGHDAEDITATAFLQLWRRRSSVSLTAGSVLPWLLVTATNSALNLRRSAGRYRSLLDALPRPGDSPDAADVFLDGNPLEGLDSLLASSLRSLGARDLELVTLVVLEGYPAAEAAGLLGLTPAAANSRLHRARHKLRSVLEPREAHLMNGERP
jgi:RNA polymerase sigma-70 factor (ECF subfamily)